MKPFCIYHGCCADGFTAAWVVWTWYGEAQVEFHAATHGEPPPAVEGRHLITIVGHTVPACNVPSPWASDAGNILAQGHPFAACFWVDGEQIAFSLRSAPDGLDVFEIAKPFDGGGHPHAAGFKLP
jgi:hypothetical protein